MKVFKSGNGVSIRIPAEIVRRLHVKAGEEVYARPDGKNRLVFELRR